MKILIDIRLLSRGGTSGIEEYTRALIRNILKVDKRNRYEFFYNSFKNKSPDVGGLVHSFGWPNKLFDLSSRIFHFPKIDKYFKII